MNNLNLTHEIKSLRTQIDKLEAEGKVLSKEIQSKQNELSNIKNKTASLKKKLEEIQASAQAPILSEHAILRYLERVKGLNLEEVKNEILDQKTKESIMFAKNGKIKRGDYTLIIKNNTVVTVED